MWPHSQKFMKRANVLRSFLTASIIRTDAATSVDVTLSRDSEALVQTGSQKIKSLAAASQQNRTELEESHSKALVPFVINGTLGITDLLEGVRQGHVTHGDLHALVKWRALSPFAQQNIQTALHQGTSQLSISEVMELLKEKLIGKEDLVLILRKGDLSLEDMEFLAERNLVPRDVADVVAEEMKESSARTNTPPVGFSKARAMLASEQLPHSRLKQLVLTGDLHPDDLSLLVSENLLSERDMDRIVESCASNIQEVYEEAEKMAEMVGDGRFTIEELEVMRAKGVLGDSLIHYLVMRKAIHEGKGRSLMEIEEDAEYLDPELTDDDIEALSPQRSYSTPKSAEQSSTEDAVPDILEKGGASDEGFYPEGIEKEDTFALWEYLSEVYANRPGREGTLDSIQEMRSSPGVRKLGVPKQQLLTDKPRHEPSLDADGKAYAMGKRKSSIAKVWLRKGNGDLTVNDRSFHDYFASMDARCYVLSPFLATDSLGVFDAKVIVKGGGWSGQAQAVRHGLARALLNFSPESEPLLKELGLLKRDSRVVERKKPGRAKARKSFQWVKR